MSLAVPIGLCFTAGWLGGLSMGLKKKEIAVILTNTDNLDVEGSKVWKDTHRELFTKQYPYVQKIVDSYRLPLDEPMKVFPDVPPPTMNDQAGPSVNDDGTRYRLTCQYEVRGGRTRQYEVLFRWRLDQLERDRWHWRVSVLGVRMLVRGQACMDPCQSLAIMRRLVECKKSIIPLDPTISLDEDLKGRNYPSHLEAINGARISRIWVLESRFSFIKSDQNAIKNTPSDRQNAATKKSSNFLKSRTTTASDTLCVRFIKHKYGMNGGLGNDNLRVSGASLWSRILAAISRLIFIQLLATRFPRLYALETRKDANISDRWSATGWSWSWRRTVRGGIEQSQLSDLTSLLVNFSCSEDIDRWW
ncbi:hypothetical protein Tco_0210281 [Tanacetum coccineum]